MEERYAEQATMQGERGGGGGGEGEAKRKITNVASEGGVGRRGETRRRKATKGWNTHTHTRTQAKREMGRVGGGSACKRCERKREKIEAKGRKGVLGTSEWGWGWGREGERETVGFTH